MNAPNLHASAIVLGTHGLLISGLSGSGKTALALALIEKWKNAGRFARLVADDQVLLSAVNGRLVAAAPAATAGLAEIFGIGPRPAEHLCKAVIDGFCRLVPPALAVRFQENASEMLHGCAIPRIELAERNVEAAMPAIAAWIAGFPGR